MVVSLSSVSDPVEVDQEVSRAAEDLVAAVRRRVDDEPRVLHAANELADRDLHLQPRERTAEAEVDAAGRADVLVVRAFEVELGRGSGTGSDRGSRTPYMRKIGEPFGMTVPAISMSARAVRLGKNWTDDSRRRTSSTPGTISSGRRRSSSRASGFRSRVSTQWEIRLTVES